MPPLPSRTQVDELRDAGASELQRRRSLEAMLKQAASLFRKELAHKSDEVAALQVGRAPGWRAWLVRVEGRALPQWCALVSVAEGCRHADMPCNFKVCACRRSVPQLVRHAVGAHAVEGAWVLSAINCAVAVLQGQLRAMRHELTTSNAYSAAAVAEAGAARAAAAAAAAAAGAAVRVASPTMAASPAVMRCCSPAAAAAAMEASKDGACCCSSDAPGAAAVVAAELQALRASRVNYQSVVLQQQVVRNNLLGSLGEVLQVGRVCWVGVYARFASLRSQTDGLPGLLTKVMLAATCITSGSSCTGNTRTTRCW